MRYSGCTRKSGTVNSKRASSEASRATDRSQSNSGHLARYSLPPLSLYCTSLFLVQVVFVSLNIADLTFGAARLQKAEQETRLSSRYHVYK